MTVYSGDQEDSFSGAMTRLLSGYPRELAEINKQSSLLEKRDVCLASIYHATGATALWVRSDGPGEKAAVLKQYLGLSYLEGIDPEDYEFSLIESLWNSSRVDDLARLDTVLTYNLVKYIHDMSHGQIKYRVFDPRLFAEAGDEHFNPVEAMIAARSVPDFRAYLESLPPRHTYYAGLRKGLARYRELAGSSDWVSIPPGPLIRPGQQDERLELIERRLALTGESGKRALPPEIYDDELVVAVRRFQSNHGLEPDGIIGTQTLAWLNRSPEDLIDIIRINMARWRWQDHDQGSIHLIVNIAGFTLKAFQEGESVLEMPVIVGKLQHKTPVFSGRIQYLEFNPYWNVPPKIAREEELPALQINSRHLLDRHIRVFSSWQSDAVEIDSRIIDWKKVRPAQMSSYKLRQDPGPWNVLGRVKFVFPNHYEVYLHDTPLQALFKSQRRTYSHGCIRVGKPLELAHFLLKQQANTLSEAEIAAIAADGERHVVRLENRIAIHITYQTAWLDKNEIIHFNSDIYNRDDRFLEALQQSRITR